MKQSLIWDIILQTFSYLHKLTRDHSKLVWHMSSLLCTSAWVTKRMIALIFLEKNSNWILQNQRWHTSRKKGWHTSRSIWAIVVKTSDEKHHLKLEIQTPTISSTKWTSILRIWSYNSQGLHNWCYELKLRFFVRWHTSRMFESLLSCSFCTYCLKRWLVYQVHHSSIF